jgi:predicted small secreted protein
MPRIKRTICLVFTILVIAVNLIGCNTMEGAGEDIERAGEEIQETAR